MSFETIIVEKKQGIATITFNRPKVFNAYSPQMSEELKQAVTEIGGDGAVRVVVLRGSGENFLAGADINMLNHWTKLYEEEGLQAVVADLSNHFAPTLLEKMPQPVIAAVDGMAWGMGSEIALGADFRICTNRASFAQPEINLGIITGGGASQRLPRIVGKSKAMEMILTGAPIAAEEAHKWGLVTEVVAPEDLDQAVLKLAKKIMAKSPLMVDWAKQCVNLALDHDLEAGLEKELAQFCKAFGTADAKEGTAAFLEKRKAEFKGC